MTETTYRQFEDADLTHPWAKQYRLPLVAHPYPHWKYQVALVVPGQDRDDIYHAVWPTEEEVQVLASLLEFTMGYYNDSWRAKMREQELDVDSSVNSLIFLKSHELTGPTYIPKPAMWSYRRATWEYGGITWPYLDTPAEVAAKFTPDKVGLINLLDKIEPWNGVSEWGAWKAQRPEVFGSAS